MTLAMPGRPRELRLGLVCYGGSSLAIYMHGVTKELHRLVKASVLRAAGEAPESASEQAYVKLLDGLVAAADGVDLRVIVDVVAGTSAGGINGIYLAKALAGNRSQDGLRQLWFERGDMNELLDFPKKILGVPLKFEWKAPFLIPRALRRSPLRGNAMTKWLHDALTDMDKGAPSPAGLTSLVPADNELDLFVTITDFYGYERSIALEWPHWVHEGRHRHALNFHYETNGHDDFSDNGGLAFAARTTSSFPAVFPPVSLADVRKATGETLDALRQRCFRLYALSGDDPDSTYFVDGGVLDNKPFGWAIDTIIERRPAEAEVDRKLLYIEPDPGGRALREGGESPDTLHAAVGALTTIPRSEPILDDLLVVQERNEQVLRIRDVIETNFDRVAALVRPMVQPATLTPPAQWPWDQWSKQVHEAALNEAGATYSTYVRLKISNVVDGLAASVNALCNYPKESNHAQLVRAVVRTWARRHGLYGTRAGAPAPDPCEAEDEREEIREPYRPTDEQVSFLRAFDLGFARRRTRFVIAAFNWWYRCVGREGFPERSDIDQGKAILYEAVAEIDRLALLHPLGASSSEEVTAARALRQRIVDVFGEADLNAWFRHGHSTSGEDFLVADGRTTVLDAAFADVQEFLDKELPHIWPRLLANLATLTEGWDLRRREDLLVRYLGFPIWDVLLYPVQSLSQLGEGDTIEIIRVSPDESTLLPAPDGMPVEGVKLGHFYAFFSRPARENDYLRGRLDAAEQLTRLLLTATGSDMPLREASKPLLQAILDEDGAALTNSTQTVAAIRDQVRRL
jgi:patatin-related protein